MRRVQLAQGGETKAKDVLSQRAHPALARPVPSLGGHGRVPVVGLARGSRALPVVRVRFQQYAIYVKNAPCAGNYKAIRIMGFAFHRDKRRTWMCKT